METDYSATTTQQLKSIAADILESTKGVEVYLFYGEPGAGKTALIKELVAAMCVDVEVTSPTFSIVQEYSGAEPVYHFDFYRLKNEDELQQIGFEEYLFTKGKKFIEWPALAIPFLHGSAAEIHISVTEDAVRHIRLIHKEY